MDVPSDLVADSRLSNGTLRVLMVLYGMCKWERSHDPFVWPSIESIGLMAGGMSRSTVGRALRQAREIGAIERAHQHGHEGFKLTPHPQAKGAIPPEAGVPGSTAVGQKWVRSESEVTQTWVRNDLPPSGPVTAPGPDQVNSDSPYNIGIKLNSDPPFPQGGDESTDKSSESDVDSAELPTNAQANLFGDSPPKPRARPKVKAKPKPATKPKPRGRPPKPRGELPETEVVQIFEALHEARVVIGEREGLSVRKHGMTPTDRDELAKLIGAGWSVEQLLESIENRGRTGGEREFELLTKHPFSAGVVNWGYKIQPHERPKPPTAPRAMNGRLIDTSR